MNAEISIRLVQHNITCISALLLALLVQCRVQLDSAFRFTWPKFGIKSTH